MNDNRYAQRCEEIAAACLFLKPICHGCNFPLGLFCWGKWLDFKGEWEEKFFSEWKKKKKVFIDEN